MHASLRAKLDGLFVAFSAIYNKGLATSWRDYLKFAQIVNSSTAIEKYPVTILDSAMREWVGERVIKKMDGEMMMVQNKDFESTVGVSLNDIEDDNIGLYTGLFESMGISAENLWAILATRALVNPRNWGDGKPFYSTDRKLGKTKISNKVAGELSLTSYEEARANMMGFASAAGDPLGLIPTTLVVGPTLEKTAKQLFTQNPIAEGGVSVGNIHLDEVEVVINPFIVGADASKWFLVCNNRGIMPIAVQKRKEGALTRWDSDSDECVKRNNRADYGIHNRGASAAMAPHLVIGGNV